jgi:phosphocarrier protein
MKSFEYTVTDSVGIHARPAGMLSREAKKYKSAICVIKNGKSANVLRLMALMGLGVKCGETVTVTIEGEDEDTVAPLIEAFFKENL